MKKIKLPNPALMIFGGLGAFWIADIINPGFNPIGVMIFMLIPVLIIEFLYPQQEIEELLDQSYIKPAVNEDVPKEPVAGELIDEEESSENGK